MDRHRLGEDSHARAAIDLLLLHLYHPRIPSSFPSERLTMLKRARYVVAIYVVAIAVAVLLVAPCLLQAQQPPISPDVYGQLKYRYIGPEGNRATSVAGVPGRPNIWYVGAASGGIFKSTDGGINWDPIFDSEPVASIGSLAVAVSDPNIASAGTRETFIRSHISVGQRSEEHTSELQSQSNLVCRLLLEKKKQTD